MDRQEDRQEDRKKDSKKESMKEKQLLNAKSEERLRNNNYKIHVQHSGI